jgi:regulator of protease activity HflC (stomatin/prohibitin superfamily)
MKISKFAATAFLALTVLASGCTRIETGDVGLRVGFDKQVHTDELKPGSFNQLIFGDVLKFSVKDIRLVLNNLTPQAADNSTLADFDASIVYNISPSTVSDLYISKDRSFHLEDKEHVYLMYHYIENVLKSAIAKTARKYDAMKMADNRLQIEKEIQEIALEAIKAEGLAGKINITQVQVTNILPAKELVDAANNVIKATSELKAKIVETQTAEQEAKRIAFLNSNSKAIEYIQAQAQMKIAEAIYAGKVTTIVIPVDFKGIVNVK